MKVTDHSEESLVPVRNGINRFLCNLTICKILNYSRVISIRLRQNTKRLSRVRYSFTVLEIKGHF